MSEVTDQPVRDVQGAGRESSQHRRQSGARLRMEVAVEQVLRVGACRPAVDRAEAETKPEGAVADRAGYEQRVTRPGSATAHHLAPGDRTDCSDDDGEPVGSAAGVAADERYAV